MKEILKLLRSSITGEHLDLAEGFVPETLDELVDRQNLAPMIYPGAANCGLERNSAWMQKRFAQYCRYILRSEQQLRVLERVFAAFQEKGIDYLPLKGCVLKKMYPAPEMRPMGDADVLIRLRQLEQIQSIMEGLGFRLHSENHHTVNYICKELFLELHKCLVPPNDGDYFSYYGDGWALAVKEQGSRYALRPEDHFLFLLVHFARHYRGSGIGCRHVVDLYVYRRANSEMDEAYLQKELKKLRLDAFYDHLLRVMVAWFEDGEQDAVTQRITDFVLSGGTWGSEESAALAEAVKAAQKRGKIGASGFRKALRLAFPEKDFLQYRYPILNRFPWLLPAIWVVRWFDVAFFRSGKVKNRLAEIRLVDDASVKRYQEELESVGLNFFE